MNAWRHRGASCTSRERSCRPATSESVSTTTSTASAHSCTTSRVTSAGTTWWPLLASYAPLSRMTPREGRTARRTAARSFAPSTTIAPSNEGGGEEGEDPRGRREEEEDSIRRPPRRGPSAAAEAAVCLEEGRPRRPRGGDRAGGDRAGGERTGVFARSAVRFFLPLGGKAPRCSPVKRSNPSGAGGGVVVVVGRADLRRASMRRRCASSAASSGGRLGALRAAAAARANAGGSRGLRGGRRRTFRARAAPRARRRCWAEGRRGVARRAGGSTPDPTGGSGAVEARRRGEGGRGRRADAGHGRGCPVRSARPRMGRGAKSDDECFVVVGGVTTNCTARDRANSRSARHSCRRHPRHLSYSCRHALRDARRGERDAPPLPAAPAMRAAGMARLRAPLGAAPPPRPTPRAASSPRPRPSVASSDASPLAPPPPRPTTPGPATPRRSTTPRAPGAR